MIRTGAHKTKTRDRSKAPRERGATTGGAESKERGESGREKETGGKTEAASGGGEMTKRGSGEAETKRGGRRLLLGSRSTGGSHAGATQELVEENESRTVGVSSVRGGDEPD